MSALNLLARRFCRLSVASAVVLAVALLIFHGIENWRGKRAWLRWKAIHEAQGIRYSPLSLVPPPVPDDENFVKVPIIDQVLKDEGYAGLMKGFQIPRIPEVLGSWRRGIPDDSTAWAAAYDAKGPEGVLRTRSALLDAVSLASLKPKCRFGHDVTKPDSDIPLLLGFRALGHGFRLRAAWRLNTGDIVGAAADILACLRIVRHLEADPNWTTILTLRTLTENAIQPLWEGLSRQKWGDRELAKIQSQLGDIDLLSTLARTLEASRILEAQQFQKSHGSMERAAAFNLWGTSEDPEGQKVGPIRLAALWLVLPKGWVYQNMVHADDFWLNGWQPVVDGRSHQIHRNRMAGLSAWTDASKRTPYTFLSGFAYPALISQTSRMAFSQAAVDQARVVCALERHRISKRNYPGRLEDLVPSYLDRIPTDILTGGPLHYTRNGEGSFTLYAVGWNGQDHGGAVSLGEGGKTLVESGDWAWPRNSLKTGKRKGKG